MSVVDLAFNILCNYDDYSKVNIFSAAPNLSGRRKKYLGTKYSRTKRENEAKN